MCLHAAGGQSIHWPVLALLSPHPLRKWQGSAIPHSHFPALLTPPDHQTCSHAAITCLSAKVMLFLARTYCHKLKSCWPPVQKGTYTVPWRPPQLHVAHTANTDGSSYPTDITLLSWFLRCIGWEEHVEPRWREKNQPGPEWLCNTTCGLMFLERSACVSSVAIKAAMTGPQCKGEGPGEVRDVQGSSMHNENLSSGHSIRGSLRSLWNEGRVSGKGKKERHTSTPFRCSFPLIFSQFDI